MTKTRMKETSEVTERWSPAALAALCLALLVGLAGCASSGTGSGSSGQRDVLTREQIMSAEATNLYDVVQRKRPEWLRTKGRPDAGGRFSGETRIVVVQGGSVIGGVRTLREFSPEGVKRLRYMEDDTAATTLVGGQSGFIEGAIIVEIGN